MNQKIKKILVIRFSSIGDIVLTSPIVRVLHHQFPQAQIYFLTQSKYVGLLNAHPHIHQVIPYNKNFWSTLKLLKSLHFDCIIDAHSKFRSRLLTFFFPLTPVFRYAKLNFKKWLMVQSKKSKPPLSHIVERYFDALAPIGIASDALGLDFFTAAPTKSDETLLATLPPHFVVCAIGAQHATKKMPLHLWKQLIEQIPCTVVLLGGESEAEDAKELAQVNHNVLQLCHKTNLQQSAMIIEKSLVVITHDTGMMHVAAAFKKPVVSIWGSTVPEFGMYPYFGQQVVNEYRAEVKNLNCRPCSKIGFSQCPKKHFHCMNQQDIHAMIQFINAQLKNEQIN